MQNITPYLESILAYAAAGNAIFPCKSENKAPLTQHGYYDCTNDADTIIECWTRWPDALVGRPEVGDELSIDVDRQHQGFIAFQQIFSASPAIAGVFRNTLIIGSRSGGGHFKLVNPHGYPFTSASQALWQGIDFKTAGKGYLIVPPSPGYRIINDAPRLEVPVEFWNLYKAKFDEKQLFTVSGGSGIVSGPDAIPVGQRNSTLTSLAGSLRRRGVTEQSLHAVLHTENGQRCAPPLPEAEVNSIVQSVMKYQGGALFISPPNVRTALIARGTDNDKRPKLQRLRDIEIKNYEFFWYPYMALGTVTALSAKGGVGKGTLTNYLATLATTGRLNELGRTDVTEPMNVLIFSKEDSPGAKIRPEVELSGGDTNRVFICNKLYDDSGFTFNDAAAFDQAFAEAFADGKPGFVVVDNAGDFGDCTNDGNNYKAVTQELTLPTDLAEKYNSALLLILHENRSGSYMGLAAYENKVRSHCSYKRTDEPNVCIWTHEKKNLFTGPPVLFGADCVDVPGIKYPVWKVYVVGEANSKPEKTKSKQDQCCDWLLDLIADGPVANDAITSEGEALGFSKVQITRARDKAGAGIIPIDGMKSTALPVHIPAYFTPQRRTA